VFEFRDPFVSEEEDFFTDWAEDEDPIFKLDADGICRLEWLV